MKTSPKFFLALSLILICTPYAAAQKRACPVPPPSPFKHNGQIITTYDRATRGMRTTMTHPRLVGSGAQGYYLTASFLHPNPKRPSRLALDILLVYAGTQANQSGKLSFVVDGRELPLAGMTARFQNVKDSQGLSHEAARITLPFDALSNLLRARKVAARVGAAEVEFSNNHLEALRELASLMAPAYASMEEE